jgi:hypothetical protein
MVPSTVPEPPLLLMLKEPLNVPSLAGVPNATVPNVWGSVADPLMVGADIVVEKNVSYDPADAAVPVESVRLLQAAAASAAIATPIYR